MCRLQMAHIRGGHEPGALRRRGRGAGTGDGGRLLHREPHLGWGDALPGESIEDWVTPWFLWRPQKGQTGGEYPQKEKTRLGFWGHFCFYWLPKERNRGALDRNRVLQTHGLWVTLFSRPQKKQGGGVPLKGIGCLQTPLLRFYVCGRA